MQNTSERKNVLPVRQTVNMRIRPGSRLPSIGIERANIAHETVASVVAIVMVCSVLEMEEKFLRNFKWKVLIVFYIVKRISCHSNEIYLTNRNMP